MRGAITHTSFGYLTPKDIASGLLHDAIAMARRARQRGAPAVLKDPNRRSRARGGSLRVYRDGSGDDLGEVSEDYFTGPDDADYSGWGGGPGSGPGPSFSPDQVRDARQGASRAALADLLAELERDKATAARGYFDQANALADDAWDRAQPSLMLSASTSYFDDSGDIVQVDAKTYPEYARAFQAYADAKNYIGTFAGGKAILQAESAGATRAVVQQNAAYEASGQAGADRAAEAARLAKYQTGGGTWKMLVDEAGDAVTGSYHDDKDVVARSAGGGNKGAVPVAGQYYGDAAANAAKGLGGAIGTGWLEDALAKVAPWALGYVALRALKII